ncbi:hypothetical protein SynROS8604_00432 [Synechococcus sp. ROS8604]|nr:hypothetical protein SynROS8604_00432 [Synechococcus sp. ROS8604]
MHCLLNFFGSDTFVQISLNSIRGFALLLAVVQSCLFFRE